MGSILKFIGITFLILLVLAFTIPLLWLVIHLIGWLFGDMFSNIGGGNLIWIFITIVSVIAIIKMLIN